MIQLRIVRTLALAAAPLLLAGEARACSKSGFVTERARDMAHLIGTAAPDTMLGGQGTVRFRVAPGHAGPAGERTVYGQVVEAERIGGLAAARLPAGTRRVLLVPWDYGPDCTPTPWMRSARWVQPGVRGLFHATLRDSALWVGGVPTLDVMSPNLAPYPLRLGVAQYFTRPDSMLSVEQLFEVMELLPSGVEQRTDPAAAAAPLVEWARANPELAQRYPAADMLRYAVYAVEGGRLRALEMPFAGTYRFVVSLGNEPPRTFYARSQSRATSGWNPSRQSRASADPYAVREPEGYVLMLSGADALDSLPAECCRTDPRIRRQAYVSVLRNAEMEPGPRGARVWRGDVEANLIARQFPGDTALAGFARAWFDRHYQLYMRREPEEVGARFFLMPDGSAWVEQTMDLEDGRRLVIRGERVSRVSISDPY